MKLVTGMVASLVIGTLSFGAFAAKEIQKEDVAKMNLTKVGSITTSRTTSPMDARRDLSKKADELGGKYFVVIAGQKNEKTVHANADVINNHHKRNRQRFLLISHAILAMLFSSQRPPLLLARDFSFRTAFTAA